eukprot:jgi/Bigna1/76117/fgenesh1_pg.39_\
MSAVVCVPERREVLLTGAGGGGGVDAASPHTVYRRVIEPYVNDALNGYECTIVAYGQKGSGKTYTLEGHGGPETGTDTEDGGGRGNALGAAPRALMKIFNTINSDAEKGEDVSGARVMIRFVEIRRNRVLDLLAAGASKPDFGERRGMGDDEEREAALLRHLESFRLHVTFSGDSGRNPEDLPRSDRKAAIGAEREDDAEEGYIAVNSFAEAGEAIHYGSQLPRDADAHRVLSVLVKSKAPATLPSSLDEPEGSSETLATRVTVKGKINFVDLVASDAPRPNPGIDALEIIAGHLAATATSSAAGLRVLEREGPDAALAVSGATHISRRRSESLLNDNSYLYDQSSLSILLKSALGGAGKCAVICTLSPAREGIDESRRALEFCRSLRKIRNEPRRMMSWTKHAIQQSLMLQIKDLKLQLRRQRDRDGVYLGSELYESIHRKLSTQSVQIADLTSQLELSRQRNDEISAYYDATSARAAFLHSNLTKVGSDLAISEEKLKEEVDASKEREKMLEIYQEMQPKLYARAQDLQNMLRRVASYAETLEAKIRHLRLEKRAKARRNSRILGQLRRQADLLGNRTESHKAAQIARISELRKMLNEREDRVASNIEKVVYKSVDADRKRHIAVLHSASRIDAFPLTRCEQTREVVGEMTANMVHAVTHIHQVMASYLGNSVTSWESVAASSERGGNALQTSLIQLMAKLNSSLANIHKQVEQGLLIDYDWTKHMKRGLERQQQLSDVMMQEHATQISQIGDVLTSARSLSEIASIDTVLGDLVQSVSATVRAALEEQYERALGLIQHDKQGNNNSEAMLFNTVEDVSSRLTSLRNSSESWGRFLTSENIQQKDRLFQHVSKKRRHASMVSNGARNVLRGVEEWALNVNRDAATVNEQLSNLVHVGRSSAGSVSLQQDKNAASLRNFLQQKASDTETLISAQQQDNSNDTHLLLQNVGKLSAEETVFERQHAASLLAFRNTSSHITRPLVLPSTLPLPDVLSSAGHISGDGAANETLRDGVAMR